jgi:hypothetical protein
MGNSREIYLPASTGLKDQMVGAKRELLLPAAKRPMGLGK